MKNLFEKPTFKTKATSADQSQGVFVISNLSRGYGTTIANSLRRTLVSSIQGAAPVAVKITGAKHEFQALEGCEEDVVSIILNLKNLVVKFEGDEPVILKLNVTKEGPVTSKSFEVPPNAEIVSKKLEIAHLEKDGALEMEVIVAKGRGYTLAEENKSYTSEVGYIAMDSNFSPVESVNFDVEEINTNKIDISEEIVVDVKTNGALSAKAALEEASEILISHYMLLTDLTSLEEVSSVIKETSEQESKTQQIMEMTLEELDLSQRSYNALKRAGHEKVSDIANLSLAQLTYTKNLGKKSVDEVVEKVGQLGFEIK